MSDPFEPGDAAPAPVAPAPAGAAYLAGLNQAQREAVDTLDGPLLVLAGAGTGKTRVLTTRLAHLLHQGRARPWEVLAVTFTNRAAREMRERVAGMLGGPAEAVWLGTFHALGARILRRHAELAGLQSNFTILDDDDQKRLVKQLLPVHHIDERRWPARQLHAALQRMKDRGLTPARMTAAEAGDLADGRFADLYAGYQERLHALNACDFGDLLLHNLELFRTEAAVLAGYQQRFRYILVDEYQDSNVAQYLWLRLLAQGYRNIACVGDDDQSIYAWRGAEVGNILKFEHDFPGARIVRLEQNYRSTGHILAAASGLISRNDSRLGKTLWTAGDMGRRVTVRGVWDAEEEARAVSDGIEGSRRDGRALSGIAVLVRTGFQMRVLEERFVSRGLPYRVVGGPRFYERLELRDAIAYLRVVHSPSDDLAFERIVNRPRRGLGDVTMQRLHAAARAAGSPLFAAARSLAETDELSPRARRALAGLVADFDRWRDLAATEPHLRVAETVLEESGYTAMWQADGSPDAPGRVENLRELLVGMAEFGDLAGFLEHVSLVMENVERAGADMVTIMTLHGAKGLEFDTVYLPGWEEGLFPLQRNMDENGIRGLEEERRLAYVGLTRARSGAHVLFAANRLTHGSWYSAVPSRFIEELPGRHVDVAVADGLYAGRGAAGDPGMRRIGAHRGMPGPDDPMTAGAAAQFVDRSAAPDGGYAAGDRIFHMKFGYGAVAAVEGNRLEIAFDEAGTKRVLDSFVVPAEQAG